MTEKNYIKYTGEELLIAVEHNYVPKPDAHFSSFVQKTKENDEARELKEKIAPYYPSKELVKVIEYARLLKRPLLLRGEPGCGKTRLAQALAYEIYKDKEENYRDYYFEWHIKSTTKAIEGLYTFDHLKRLRDVQMTIKSIHAAETDTEKKALKERLEEEDVFQYRSFGPLGKAFIQSTSETPAILLIDEIDKADIDFPNDLLLELDQKRFTIEETKEEIVANYPPIIIITSNDEKELPNAFLRRCVFYFIDFPDRALLLKIALAKSKNWLDGTGDPLPPKLIEHVVDRFLKIQKDLKGSPNSDKAPSTSELLDWLQVFHYYLLEQKLDYNILKKTTEDGKEEEEVFLLEKRLDQDNDEITLVLKDDVLLFPEVLLKTLNDYQLQKKKDKPIS